MRRTLSKTDYHDLAQRILATLKANGENRNAFARRLDVPSKYVYSALDGTQRRPTLLLRMARELAIPTEAAA